MYFWDVLNSFINLGKKKMIADLANRNLKMDRSSWAYNSDSDPVWTGGPKMVQKYTWQNITEVMRVGPTTNKARISPVR